MLNSKEAGPGIHIRTVTGEVERLNPDGTVNQERATETPSVGGFQFNPQAYARVMKKNGESAEAAAALGQDFQPSFIGRATGLVTENTSLLKVGMVMLGGYATVKTVGWGVRKFKAWRSSKVPAMPEATSKAPLRSVKTGS